MIGLPHGENIWRYVRPFSSDTGTLRTDGRTDRQTDRRTDLLYQYRASVCWRAIKTAYSGVRFTERADTPLCRLHIGTVVCCGAVKQTWGLVWYVSTHSHNFLLKDIRIRTDNESISHQSINQIYIPQKIKWSTNLTCCNGNVANCCNKLIKNTCKDESDRTTHTPAAPEREAGQ